MFGPLGPDNGRKKRKEPRTDTGIQPGALDELVPAGVPVWANRTPKRAGAKASGGGGPRWTEDRGGGQPGKLRGLGNGGRPSSWRSRLRVEDVDAGTDGRG